MPTPLSRYSPQDAIDQQTKSLKVDEATIQNMISQLGGGQQGSSPIQINSNYQQPSVQRDMASLEAAMLMGNANQNPERFGGHAANRAMQGNALRLESEAQEQQQQASQQKAMQEQQMAEQAEIERRKEYVMNVGPMLEARYPGMDPEKIKAMALQAAAQNTPIEKLLPDTAGSFETLSPEQAAQMGLNPEGSYQRDTGSGKISAIGGGGTTVNVGDRMPPDMISDGQGGWIPRPGSDTDYKRSRDKMNDAQASEKAATTAANRTAGIQRAGGTVVQDLGRAKALITDMVGGGGVVGANARLAKSKLAGTPEYYVNEFIDSAKSNIGLDKLQQMRESSPSGGALGQVPIQQQLRLEKVLGTADVGMTPAMMDDNISRIQNIYFDIMYGSKPERNLAIEQGKMTQEESDQIDSQYFDLSFDELGMPVEGGANNEYFNISDEDLMKALNGG